jgi:hypothetical protein
LPLSAALPTSAADPAPRPRFRRRALTAALLAGTALALVPAAGHAATVTFGSPLSVPATLNTTDDLNYRGSDVATPGHVVHITHNGADTVLWNPVQAAGAPTAPSDGQIVSAKLEGCAQPASGAAAPLTQFHFQDLAPQGGGAVRVNATSQPFDIPICGQGGAGGSTVTTYQLNAFHFCVKSGDFFNFNDEGGFASGYPSGVPYQVIGAVPGSTMNSYINEQGGQGNVNNSTGNGGMLSPNDTSDMGGFASNAGKELMLQAVETTGSDANPACGGSAGTTPTVALKVRPQTDGVNHSRVVKVALFCAQATPCTGSIALVSGATQLATGTLNVPGHKTSHVALRLSAASVKKIRAHHRRLTATMQVTLASGQTFSGPVTLKV